MTDSRFPTYQEQLDQLAIPAGKRKVMLAAIALFSKQGFHATSTAQIAAEAEVSQATIFKHFKTKDDLLLGVCEPLIDLVGRPFLDGLKACPDTTSLVHFFVQDRFAFVAANSDLLKIIFQELQTSEVIRQQLFQSVHPLLPELTAIVTNILEKDGIFSPKWSQVTLLRTFMAPLFTYVVQRFFIGMPSDQEVEELGLIEQQILASLSAL